MTTAVRPSAGTEGAVTPGSEGTPSNDQKPQVSALEAAAEVARDLIHKKQQDLNGTPAEETPEQIAEREKQAALDAETPEAKAAREALENETPEEKTARETAEAETVAKRKVKLPGARPEDEEFEVEFADEDSAERVRQLTRGYMRGEQARKVREEGQAQREKAEEIELMVDLDPVSFLTTTIQRPQDRVLLAQHLLTEPGMLDHLRAWLDTLDDPNEVTRERAVVEARFVKRKELVGSQIQEERAIRANARKVVQATHSSIEASVPADFDEDAKALLFEDVLADTRAWARQNNMQTVDPGLVPRLVERRLKLMRVAPRVAAQPPVAGTPAPTGATSPRVTPAQTAEALRTARTAKAAAASAPPGAGSPVGMPPKPPAYDPAKKGSAIEQAANWAKGYLANRGKKPQ